MKARLALACLATLAALFLSEFLLSRRPTAAEVLRQQRLAAANARGIPFDTRTKRQVVEELRNQGIDAVPTIHASEFLQHRTSITIDGKSVIPLSGVSRCATVFGNESGTYLVYESDEHGFHNPPGLFVPGRVPLAIIGDSFAHGAQVSSDCNAAALIRRQIPGTLNLGYGGNGPLCNLATIREYAAPLQPRIVLWFHYEGNDLEELETEWTTIVRQYLLPGFSQKLFEKRTKLDGALRAFVDKEGEFSDGRVGEFLTSLLLPRLRQGVLARTRRWDFEPQRMTAFASVIRAAKLDCEGFGGQLLFVYLPAYSRYQRPNAVQFPQQQLLGLVRAENIPIIDLVPDFDRQSDPLTLFPMGLLGHYTEAGYSLVAEAVLHRLEQSPSGALAPTKPFRLDRD